MFENKSRFLTPIILFAVSISLSKQEGVLEDFGTQYMGNITVCLEGDDYSFTTCADSLRVNLLPVNPRMGYYYNRKIKVKIENPGVCVYVNNVTSTPTGVNNTGKPTNASLGLVRCLLSGVYGPLDSPADDTVVFHFKNRDNNQPASPRAIVYWGAKNDPRNNTVYTPMKKP